MKPNKTNKTKKQFDPVHHWYLILLIIFFLTILIISYSVYSFLFLKNEIALMDLKVQNNSLNTVSNEFIEKSRKNMNSLSDINNLNKTLEEFNKKEIEYNKLIKAPAVSAVIETLATSTTVATSTN